MAKIHNPKYAIDITHDPASGVYILTEPQNERTITFLVDAALFIRDHSANSTAIIKLRNNELMDFGPCGTTLSLALVQIFHHFVANKRDQFLSVVDASTIDDDGQLEVVINPARLDRQGQLDQLSDGNVIGYYLQNIQMLFHIFAARELLPEFLPLLVADADSVRRAMPLAMQKRIGEQPIRFVNPRGKRISLVNREHPTLGRLPDIDIG